MKARILLCLTCLIAYFSTSCDRSSTDKTSQLAEIGKVMALNRAWIIERHDDGKDYLSVAPAGAPGDIPPGTEFRITKLLSGTVMGGGPYNDLSIEFLSDRFHLLQTALLQNAKHFILNQ